MTADQDAFLLQCIVDQCQTGEPGNEVKGQAFARGGVKWNVMVHRPGQYC